MTQHLYIIISAATLIISMLIVVIVIDKKQIRRLKHKLEEEHQRRIMPFLNLAIDRKSLSLCLVNEGETMVRDISIRDVITTVEIGFQKRIGIRFFPIENLKPGESIPLNIAIYDNGQAIPPTIMKRMGGVLLSASFRASVKCKNMEGIPFHIDIIKKGPRSKIGRIIPLKEEAPAKTPHKT